MPCNEPHTAEIVSSGITPAGAKYDAYPFVKCTTADALTYAGYPNYNGKDIKNPSRVSPFPFAVKPSAGDNEFGYVCAVSVFTWNGEKNYTLATLGQPLPNIVAAGKPILDVCGAGKQQDVYAHTLTTAPCGKAKTWKAVESVWLGKPFSKYPGEKKIRDIMMKKCGFDSKHVFTYPTKDNWKYGSNRSWCYEYFPKGS